MKYEIRFTTQFKKDLKKARKQNKSLDELFSVVNVLAEGDRLEARYHDHELTGDYAGTRECHIEPDWLLIYERKDSILVLILYRTGSHAGLFRS